MTTSTDGGYKMEELLHDGFCRVTKTLDREVVHATDSAAVLVYCRDRRALLLVRQFRVPVKRLLIEPVAGRLDKPGWSIERVLVDELLIEAGVLVEENDLVFLNDRIALAIDPGLLSSLKTLAYVEVEDWQLENAESFGDPDEDEFIKRIFLPIDQIDAFRPDCLTAFALLMWFKAEKLPKLLTSHPEV